MTEFMAELSTAGTALVGYVAAAAGAGIGAGIVYVGARRAWAAFKGLSK